jgi:hypothetical protein
MAMTTAAIALALGMDIVTAQQPAPGSSAGSGQSSAPVQGQGPGRGRGGFTQPEPVDFQAHEGWTSLFDGKTLDGWSGDKNWKVEDGAITIESTCEQPTGTVYLVWQGGEAADFELKMEMKGTGDINGGIQYRSWIAPRPQRAGGPGVDCRVRARVVRNAAAHPIRRLRNNGTCGARSTISTPPTGSLDSSTNNPPVADRDRGGSDWQLFARNIWLKKLS